MIRNDGMKSIRAPVSTPARNALPLLVSLERRLVQKLATDAERRSRRLARKRALERFARSNPLWHDSLFDPRLLRRIPDDYFKRNATSVARSWTMQFPYRSEASRDRDVERLLPVAQTFLQILAEEEARVGLGTAS